MLYHKSGMTIHASVLENLRILLKDGGMPLMRLPDQSKGGGEGLTDPKISALFIHMPCVLINVV